MVYKIFHNIDGEKTSIFNSDEELIAFAKKIANENDDLTFFCIEDGQDAADYIREYCPNLSFVIDL